MSKALDPSVLQVLPFMFVRERSPIAKRITDLCRKRGPRAGEVLFLTDEQYESLKVDLIAMKVEEAE